MSLRPEFRPVDSRAYGAHVDSRAYVQQLETKPAEELTIAVIRQVAVQEVHRAIADAEHLHSIVREHVATAEHLKGEPGKDGATLEQIQSLVEGLVKSELQAHHKAGYFRGATGATGARGEVGPQGPQGTPGLGIQGPEGKVGPQGEQGPRGHQGPAGPEGQRGPQGERGERGVQGLRGEPGRDSVALETIIRVVQETVFEALSSKVTIGVLPKILEALNEIDAKANMRPSLRPVYTDMTSRIREIIHSHRPVDVSAPTPSTPAQLTAPVSQRVRVLRKRERSCSVCFKNPVRGCKTSS